MHGHASFLIYMFEQGFENQETYSVCFIMFLGKGPNTLSIIARCSKSSYVWNNVSPYKFTKVGAIDINKCDRFIIIMCIESS